MHLPVACKMGSAPSGGHSKESVRAETSPGMTMF
jgi:hypothetical protein